MCIYVYYIIAFARRNHCFKISQRLDGCLGGDRACNEQCKNVENAISGKCGQRSIVLHPQCFCYFNCWTLMFVCMKRSHQQLLLVTQASLQSCWIILQFATCLGVQMPIILRSYVSEVWSNDWKHLLSKNI